MQATVGELSSRLDSPQANKNLEAGELTRLTSVLEAQRKGLELALIKADAVRAYKHFSIAPCVISGLDATGYFLSMACSVRAPSVTKTVCTPGRTRCWGPTPRCT
jgi:hypothetical protein